MEALAYIIVVITSAGHIAFGPPLPTKVQCEAMRENVILGVNHLKEKSTFPDRVLVGCHPVMPEGQAKPAPEEKES